MNSFECFYMTSDRAEAEEEVERFISFAQSMFWEQKPHGDFPRYLRLLGRYCSKFDATINSIDLELQEVWDGLFPNCENNRIQEAIEEMLHGYISKQNEQLREQE